MQNCRFHTDAQFHDGHFFYVYLRMNWNYLYFMCWTLLNCSLNHTDAFTFNNVRPVFL